MSRLLLLLTLYLSLFRSCSSKFSICKSSSSCFSNPFLWTINHLLKLINLIQIIWTYLRRSSSSSSFSRLPPVLLLLLFSSSNDRLPPLANAPMQYLCRGRALTSQKRFQLKISLKILEIVSPTCRTSHNWIFPHSRRTSSLHRRAQTQSTWGEN